MGNRKFPYKLLKRYKHSKSPVQFVLSVCILLLTISIPIIDITRAEVAYTEFAWSDEFDDGVTTNISDYYGIGQTFSTITEVGGKVTLADGPGGNAWATVAIDPGQTFASHLVKFRLKVNTAPGNLSAAYFYVNDWGGEYKSSTVENDWFEIEIEPGISFDHLGLEIDLNSNFTPSDTVEIEWVGVNESRYLSLANANNYDARFIGLGGGWLGGNTGFKAGDVNGDNISDIVLNSWISVGATNEVYIKFGGNISGDYDLSQTSNYNVKIVGLNPDYSRITIGDINGDNKDDLMMAGDMLGDTNLYIFFSTLLDDFGSTTGNVLDLTSDPDSYSIKYSGFNNGYFIYFDPIRIDDMNGDGKEDLVLCNSGENLGGSAQNDGAVYIIYSTLIDDVGTTTGNDKDLSVAGDFNIKFTTGEFAEAGLRISEEDVFLTGDVNGDGLSDLTVGGQYLSSTRIWVIFSTLIDDYASTGNILPFTTATNYNVRYEGAYGDSTLGVVAGLMIDDVNGDGLSDLSFIDTLADYNGADSGSTYLIFSTLMDDLGTSTGNAHVLSSSGTYNLRFDSAGAGDRLGESSGIYASDFNGDSDKDLVLTSYQSDLGPGVNTGSLWIIKSSIVASVGSSTGNTKELSTGTNYNVRYDGYVAGGPFMGLNHGLPEIGFADLDADGIGDLSTAYTITDFVNTNSGSIYVARSSFISQLMLSTGNVKLLNDFSGFGYRYDGPGFQSQLTNNARMQSADINGDGITDLMVRTDDNGGYVYVIFGGKEISITVPSFSLTPLDHPSASKFGGVETFRLTKSGIVLADIDVTFQDGKNKIWNDVTGDIDTSSGKSVVTNLSQEHGASSEHILYVPIPTGVSSNRVIICPSATTLSEVSASCSGGLTKQESDADTDKVTITGQQYWRVTGLTGTGGIATNYTPPPPDDNPDVNASPTINIVEPDGAEDMLGTGIYTIKWEDADPDDDAKISIYYDVDNNGEDGTLIVADLSEDDQANEYLWDITNLPLGSYYIYIIIDDGEADPVVVYSSGTFTKIPIECEIVNNDDNPDNDDSDCDGMPNTWETDHGLNINDASDAPLNTDADGCSNLDEYVNDKDPDVYDCEIPLPTTGEDSSDGNAISAFINQIIDFINSDQAEELTQKVINPVLSLPPVAFAISALMAMLPVLANSPAVLLPGILGVLTRKKKDHWGIVYDKKTRKPIAFAVVRLIGEKETTTRVTDLEGRYSFVTSPGNFRLTVSHSDFKGFASDLNVGTDNTVSIDLDIPLEPKVFSFFEKIGYGIKQFFRNFVKNFGLIVLIVGLLFSIIAFVISPILINGLILAVYAVLLLLYRRINRQFPRNWGRAVDSENSKGISEAFVKLFKEEAGGSRLIDTAVTDRRGKYGFLIDKEGNYMLLASAPSYIFPSQKEKHEKAWNNVVIKVVVGKEKVLRDDLLLDRQAGTQSSEASKDTKSQKSSPFA